MPAMPPPVADERQAIRDFLFQQQYAFKALAFGLTDDQARATPSVSALSVGALIKHVTNCQHGWMQRVASAPEAPQADGRSVEERQAEYRDEFVMKPDETLAALLERLDASNDEALQLVEDGRSRRGRARPARRAMVPQGRRGVVGAMGVLPHARGADPPRRPGRRHPREHRRGLDVRAGGGAGGVAGDLVAQAVPAAELMVPRRDRASAAPGRHG